MRALPVGRFGFVLLGAFALSFVAALSLTAPSLSARADEGETRERVIVMMSGRILTGQMTRNAGGWLVEHASGRVQVPDDQVKVVADSLRDAYRKQRDAIVEPTPATHMMLAHWCITYRLNDEARDELKKCLKRDPDHEEARKLLRRLEESLTAKTITPQSTVLPLRTPDGFVVPEVESLGGLSKETATSFTARVQPLLINKCGNASCHGATSRGEFKLHSTRLGANGNRMHTERNLAEALRYIDIHDPALSPLLTAPQGGHAGATAIFHGPQGNEQLKTLRTWIKQVSHEKRNEEQELAQRPSVLSKKKSSPGMGGVPATQANSSGTTQSKSNSTQSKPRSSVPHPADLESPQPLISDETATPLDEDDSNDLFDPHEFNRRFHGVLKSRK